MNNRTRNLRAGFIETYLLLNEFRIPLIFFLLAILGFGTYYFFNAQSLIEPLKSLPEAYDMILWLALFQSSGNFPQYGALRIWFFSLPVIGIGTLARVWHILGSSYLIVAQETRSGHWQSLQKIIHENN